MQKTEIVHTRVSPETKAACEEIFNKLGITTSYAITMFLKQVALRKGFPFEIALPENEDLVEFAINTNSVGAGKPNKKAQQIMELFAEGLIDYETAESAIYKLHGIKK